LGQSLTDEGDEMKADKAEQQEDARQYCSCQLPLLATSLLARVLAQEL
jgi:hypothetical protein